MEMINTRYGILQGVSYTDYHPNGMLRNCVVVEPNELPTPYGVLVPLYKDNEIRRKTGKPMTFYPNGCLKNLPLQKQTDISTSLGILPGEYLSFYEDGSLHRVFPLDGKLSGYWNEEDERQLAHEMEFQLLCGQFKSKIIGVQFYPEGFLKSVTLWPGEVVAIESPLGPMEVRTGLSFYPRGRIKSLEPVRPTPVLTPVGIMHAYDCQSLGLSGDANSLCFSEEGTLVSLLASTDQLEITGKDGEKHLFQPGHKPNLFNPEVMDPIPLKVEFFGKGIRLYQDRVKEFHLQEYIIRVKPLELQMSCSGCAGCTGCNSLPLG
ncbi:hypothetical protein [Desulforamulus ruminis]|uniref:Uncharacterized protein n=1 Tax=Desulforamulus ruminis (strain ATCC 23193 / DSM 2154 / NCIMB 8452 / DL) TaxID=696281 RepID=F6DSE2_DESRL|nr:hypothetical protein [Desulforamulus ruminis]AEG59921.1 hypothetical protein Desru_1656 [Desulforamulus ruminis DSM 2154]